jgi:hypothetical protein
MQLDSIHLLVVVDWDVDTFTISFIVTASVVPITRQVYVPASDGSGLVMVNIDTRDGTSSVLLLAAVSGDPFEKVI